MTGFTRGGGVTSNFTFVWLIMTQLRKKAFFFLLVFLANISAREKTIMRLCWMTNEMMVRGAKSAKIGKTLTGYLILCADGEEGGWVDQTFNKVSI